MINLWVFFVCFFLNMQRCTVAGCVFLSGLRPPGWAFHTHVHIPLCTYVDLYVVVLFFNCTSLISFGFLIWILRAFLLYLLIYGHDVTHGELSLHRSSVQMNSSFPHWTKTDWSSFIVAPAQLSSDVIIIKSVFVALWQPTAGVWINTPVFALDDGRQASATVVWRHYRVYTVKVCLDVITSSQFGVWS